jgi:hypothetical protein
MRKANAFSTLGQHEGEKASRRSSRSGHLDTSYIQCHTEEREMRKANIFPSWDDTTGRRAAGSPADTGT